MKLSEGTVVLLFILSVVGMGIIAVSEDYSRNAMVKVEQQQQEIERLARTQQAINQFRAEEEIRTLGCVTLDCAIERSMERQGNK